MENRIFRSYINGSFLKSPNQTNHDIIFPATGKVVSSCEYASEKNLDEAVQGATKGQKQWAALLPSERSRVLHKAALLIRERNSELAMIDVLDTGKPIQEADAVDICSGADAVEYFASATATMKGDFYTLGQQYSYTEREPLGVVAGIGAWNYPFQIACWKSAPALAAGNSMIYKPSELTPMSACFLAEIYTQAGLPDGVFNVVLGDAELGKNIVKHAGIKKISLTGEVETGQKVYTSCAEQLKHVTLELGGKSPLIIFEDADIPNAVRASMVANFYTQGQICSNGTRVFVHKNIQKKFEQQLVDATNRIRIGDPRDPNVQFGSLINFEHKQKVASYIELGLKEGAKLLSGGKTPSFPNKPDISSDCYIEPTIFTDCHDDMSIAKEEIFGPVMSTLTFNDQEEVLNRANNTRFGLAAGAFTQDMNRARRVSRTLETGICWINNYNITPIEVPFGGVKNSGLGRENSLAALEHYTQIKTVYIETQDVDSPYEV
ncbi:MAG: betaine-aldehyde dehydrogenase [Oligoflexales bacterium]